MQRDGSSTWAQAPGRSPCGTGRRSARSPCCSTAYWAGGRARACASRQPPGGARTVCSAAWSAGSSATRGTARTSCGRGPRACPWITNMELQMRTAYANADWLLERLPQRSTMWSRRHFTHWSSIQPSPWREPCANQRAIGCLRRRFQRQSPDYTRPEARIAINRLTMA